jgi:probable FeS assembly SUF system protein SufT
VKTNEPIKLSRDLEAVGIPSGEKMALPAGTEVRVMQSLGGTYTLMTDLGYMVRIDGKDADAIGQEVARPSSQPGSPAVAGGPAEVERLVWDQLRTVYDPEIPVNVVELGLIYSCKVTPLPGGGNKVDVVMTLTAPGCGMGDVLREDAKSKILSVPGVKEASVEMVIEPPWNPDMMSEAAKLELGMM